MVAFSTGWCYIPVLNGWEAPGAIYYRVVLWPDTKWLRKALCYRTGTKSASVPGLKQPVLIGGGRMTLFLAVWEKDVSWDQAHCYILQEYYFLIEPIPLSSCTNVSWVKIITIFKVSSYVYRYFFSGFWSIYIKRCASVPPPYLQQE